MKSNMTPMQFTAAVMQFYEGQYSKLDARYLGPWIENFHAEGGDLEELLDCLTEVFSKTFGKLPDKARMVEARKLLEYRRTRENRYEIRDEHWLALPPPERPQLTTEDEHMIDVAITGIVEFFASKGKTLRMSLDDDTLPGGGKTWDLTTHTTTAKPKEPRV